QDIARFIVSALQPAEVAKVVLDEVKKRMDVVVPEEQLSKAIGSRGQNVRLASMLCGWDIDIMTEAEESERRAEEFATRSALFIAGLDVDEVIAQLLVSEGFATIEEIAETPVDEMMQIQGFDEEVAAELINRANTFLDEQEAKLKEQSEKLGIQQDLLDMDGLTPDQII